MAATRGILTPYYKDGPRSEVSRRGHAGMTAHADTWGTFTTASVAADGSGYVRVERPRGHVIHTFSFGPEGGSE